VVQKNISPILIVTGPTSVGKTELTVDLARQINGEIISADAFQIYKELNLGTAKPTREHRDAVPHHLVDIISFQEKESFSVNKFLSLAMEKVNEILSRGRLPIIVGGTTLYLRALLHGLFEGPGGNESLRKNLLALARKKGKQVLHQKLNQVDPERARSVHPNDIFRLVRALEIYELTGKPMSTHWKTTHSPLKEFQTIKIGLIRDRASLYYCAEKRIDRMIKQGLLEEIRILYGHGFNETRQAAAALGYRQLLPVIKGERSLEQGMVLFRQNTRHLIKRQLTWIHHEPGFQLIPLDSQNPDNLLKLKRAISMPS